MNSVRFLFQRKPGGFCTFIVSEEARWMLYSEENYAGSQFLIKGPGIISNFYGFANKPIMSIRKLGTCTCSCCLNQCTSVMQCYFVSLNEKRFKNNGLREQNRVRKIILRVFQPFQLHFGSSCTPHVDHGTLFSFRHRMFALLDTSCRDLPIGVQSPDIIDVSQLSFRHSTTVTRDPDIVRLTSTWADGAGSFDPSLNQLGGYNSDHDDQKHYIGVRVDAGKTRVLTYTYCYCTTCAHTHLTLCDTKCPHPASLASSTLNHTTSVYPILQGIRASYHTKCHKAHHTLCHTRIYSTLYFTILNCYGTTCPRVFTS